MLGRNRDQVSAVLFMIQSDANATWTMVSQSKLIHYQTLQQEKQENDALFAYKFFEAVSFIWIYDLLYGRMCLKLYSGLPSKGDMPNYEPPPPMQHTCLERIVGRINRPSEHYLTQDFGSVPVPMPGLNA